MRAMHDIMTKRGFCQMLAIAGALVATSSLAACGTPDARQDATKSGQKVDRSAAEVLAMPDAFRNVATKCDGHGHRVYSSSTGDSGNAAQIFVIDDPSCVDGQP
jgi:hypothetical protein